MIVHELYGHMDMVILYRLEYQRMDEINEVYWGKKSVNKEWLVNIVIFCIYAH